MFCNLNDLSRFCRFFSCCCFLCKSSAVGMVSSSSSSSEKSASSFQNVIFLLSFQTPILFNIRESRDKKYAKPLVLLLLVVERRRKQRVCRYERERLRRASLCAHVFNKTNEEWICPHYVILGHFSKRDQKESHHRKNRKKTLFGLFFSRPKEKTLLSPLFRSFLFCLLFRLSRSFSLLFLPISSF